MPRLRTSLQIRRRKPIYKGTPFPLTVLADGQVRCPSCNQPVTLTPSGRLRKHGDREGADCPQRLHEGRPLDDGITFPPVVVDRPTPTGCCHDCDRPVTGERLYCGRCLAVRL